MIKVVARLREDSRLSVGSLAALTLILELALIRWLATNVFHLGFFTNFVLLACFLGIGLGFLVARRERDLFGYGPYALFAVMAVTTIGRVQIDLPLSGEDVVFVAATAESSVIPVPLFLVLLFSGVVATFCCISQATGRAFQKLEPLQAYTWDIGGSLTGIAIFTLMSALWAPSWVWFVLVAILWALLLAALGWRGPRLRPLALSLVACIALGLTPDTLFHADRVVWSPYQLLTVYQAEEDASIWHIMANRIPHQTMRKSEDQTRYRWVPYEVARDHGKTDIDRVLVVGAGSGSDVAIALGEGAMHVDAAELDPAIAQLGRELHPDRPYDDPRVEVIVGDARHVLETTQEKYDLVVFAMPDSLSLLSTQSSVRLESFLFTRESFEAVREVLKPDGVFAMYNYYRDPNIVSRLSALVTEVFGHPPKVKVWPDGLFAVLTVSRDIVGEGFPAEDPSVIESLPEDDWPFLYLMKRAIPAFYFFPLIVLLALSVIAVRVFAPRDALQPGPEKWPLFLMGAAFLLLETKSIVLFSLLFGATWLVNSLVFAGVLVMVLAANALVHRFRPRFVWPWYMLLAVSLFVGWWVPLSQLSGIESSALRYVAAVLVVFLPIFFANVIFASTYVESDKAEAAFGWNLLGTMVGGVAEYGSLALGYRHLAIVVAILYALALFTHWQARTRQRKA